VRVDFAFASEVPNGPPPFLTPLDFNKYSGPGVLNPNSARLPSRSKTEWGIRA
jgi:hypothetical protein